MPPQGSASPITPPAETNISSAPVQEVPQPQVPQNFTPPPTVEPEKKPKKALLFAAIAIVIIAALSAGFIFFRDRLIKSPEVIQETDEQEQTVISPGQIEVPLNSEISFFVDKDQDISVVEWNDNHSLFRLPQAEGRVEIEAVSKSNTKANVNPLIVVSSKQTQNLSKGQISQESGEEVLGSGKASYIGGTWETANHVFNIRSFAPDSVKAQTNFQKLATQVSIKLQAKNRKFIKEARAQEVSPDPLPVLLPPPANLPKVKYGSVKVMQEPLLEDMITKDDLAYKTGYVKGYSFFAFKSQRLIALALEDRASNPGSFVESQLFDENGKELSGVMGTRIEFRAPYSGYYYFLVNSFGNQEGKIRVGVEDRDQTDVKTIMKYPSGTEVLKDPAESDSKWVGQTESALIIEMINPITVVSENTISYESLPVYGFITPARTIRSTIQAYAYNGEDGLKRTKDADFEIAEGVSGSSIPFKITQIGTNRVLITPQEGLFKPGYQYSLNEATEGIIRFFTLDNPESETGVIETPVL